MAAERGCRPPRFTPKIPPQWGYTQKFRYTGGVEHQNMFHATK